MRLVWAQTIAELGRVRATMNAEQGMQSQKRGCTHLYLLISLRLALCQAYDILHHLADLRQLHHRDTVHEARVYT